MSSDGDQLATNEGFDHKAPRPPVPGEEKSHFMSDWGPPPSEARVRVMSPSLSPKKSFNLPTDLPIASGPFEQSLCRSSTSCLSSRLDHRYHDGSSSSSPSCLRWAQSLHSLLQDGDGVKLFRQYLESEGKQHADALDFWFACEGLRKQPAPERIQQLAKLIYKKFFVKSALPIPEDLRKEIGSNIKSSSCLEPPVTLFDEAQAIIENLIVNTTYPNFLKSDMYLQYLENAQNSSSGSSSDFSSNELLPNMVSGSDPLPTLHEDVELIMNHPVHISHTSGTVSTGYHTPTPSSVRLTKDVLLLSAKSRAIDIRPKTEAFAGLYVSHALGAHAAYNSYNPVSRQDSELHSLSSHSDARTDSDAMSMTDSSVDGRSINRMSRRQAVLDARQVRESAALNRETHMNQIVIPRTQRIDKSHVQQMDREKFAKILFEKLEVVRRSQEAQEMLDKKLKESESMSSMSDLQSRELSNAIREKLQLEDESDQDILDDHVSKVFPDTPVRSPPGSWTPTKSRHLVASRRRKDGSTFSGDSGNVRDFAESLDHRSGMVKSRSVPEYGEERFARGAVGRRSSSRKALTELTDSGVSVVSDTPPVSQHKDKVMAWLMDTNGRGASHTHSEMSTKHRVGGALRTGSTTSPLPTRHGRKVGLGSRSSSVERTGGAGAAAAVAPAQPFVADTGMPPPPLPNTALQLEEARRRLLEDDLVRARSRQRTSSGRHYPEASTSCQSTLRKSGKVPSRPLPSAALPPPPPDEQTTVVFSFCDEQFPYRTKIPGASITLRQFKEYLPRKGNYRFFFKTVCEELGNQVIQEEISNDADIVPLWEGRIMAQVKPVD